MKKHLDITVKGKVQGVYFRRDTQLQANKLGVLGTVKNQDDGSVYIEAEAEESVLEQFVSWCHQGPEMANVSEVLVTEGDLKPFTEFMVLADPSDYLGKA
jgi:acylphosphatase